MRNSDRPATIERRERRKRQLERDGQVKRDHIRQGVATLLFVVVVAIGGWSSHGEIVGLILVVAALLLFLEAMGAKIPDEVRKIIRRMRNR